MWTNLITGSVPLALCTVLFRRIVESAAGRIPRVPETNSPTATALLVASGALYYLYKHLRLGTLVSIGRRPLNRSATATSRHTNAHHSAGKSWFLKKLFGGRRNCTEAISKLAESMEADMQIDSDEENSNRRVPQSCNRMFKNDSFYEDSEQEITQVLKENKKKRGSSIEKKNTSINKSATKKCNVKRLVNDRKSLGITLNKCTAKGHIDGSRRTRSGKVYNTST